MRNGNDALRRGIRRLACTALAAGTLLATMAVAQVFPDRPLKLVVTYPAGGSTDVIARVIATRLGERLKQPVVVDNRPGASGMIGSELVAKSAPDGYTLIMAVADTHSINPHVYANIRYDARRDFTPVAMIGYVSYALIVTPSVAATTVPQFVALAKEKPGKLTFASWGVGSSSQVAVELLKADAKVDLLHVPFQGAAPAISAVIGGQVDAMMVPLTLAEPNQKAGKVKLLAVAAEKRFPGAPDAPTFAEQGMPMVAGVWLGVLGPANLPEPVVTLLNREINAVLNDAQVRETLVKNGLDAMPQSAPQFRTYLDSEYEKWGRIVKGAAIKAE